MEPRNWAIVIWALYVASFVTGGVTALIGLIIAYVKRPELSSTPYDSHVSSAIRTFWIGVVGTVIGVSLSLIGIGYVLLLLMALWALFRSLRGLIKAVDRKPIDDPLGWL